MVGVSSGRRWSTDSLDSDLVRKRHQRVVVRVQDLWGQRYRGRLVINGGGKDWLREVYGIDRVQWNVRD